MAGVVSAACGPTPPSGIDAGLDAGPQLPCDVGAVLRTRCQPCHGAPPTQGAPFPLLTQADFQATYFSSTVRAAALEALRTDFMPLGGPPLNAADKAVLVDWLDAGVPLGTTNCP